MNRSRSLLLAVVLTSVAGLTLGLTAIRSALAREDTYRTAYASTATLVRDRLLVEISRLESALAADLAAGNLEPNRAWLQQIAAGHPWLSQPFIVHADGGVLTSDLALEWPPATDTSARLPRVAARLQEGERAEFAASDLELASRVYLDAVRSAPPGHVQAIARMRLGRVLFKLRRYEAGIQHYRSVLGSHGTAPDPTGVPFGIGALEQIAAGFDALGRTSDRDAALRDLREAVLAGPWDVGRGYDYYLKRAAAGAPAPDPRVDRITERLETIRWLESEIAARVRSDLAAASNPHLVIDREGAPAILGWRPIGPEGRANMALGYQIPAAHVAGPLLSGVLQTVDTARDVLIDVRTGSAPPGALAAAPIFDWTVVLLHRHGYSMPQLVARERWTYGALVGGMLAVLGVGLALATRAASREAQLARLRTEFVANVSHELKTPLALIRMYGETLESGIVQSSEERREFSGVIRRESERLTHLINNVLDAARIEAGTKQYHLAPADLASLTRQAIDAYRPFLVHLGFDLHAQIPDRPVMLPLDPDAIVQALLNLLHNAVKYSDDRRHVTVALTSDDSHGRLSVTDEGIGLAASEIPRVFEKYYRVGGTQARTGSGLGLSIVAHAMTAHGGRVDVASVEGHGSTFTLVFPPEAACRES